MPQNHKLASENWLRYTYMRDIAHLEYLEKARRCRDYVNGKQWDPAIKAALAAVNRPAMTINKTYVTLCSILGEQIDLRTEIAFKGRYGAPSDNADALTKVFRYISDKNQLDWVRSEMFCDGAITSRGYVDVRMNFDKSITGDVKIGNVNSKNVLPDPDGSEYDPDEWNDIVVTKWYRPDDIEYLYNKEDADELRKRGESTWAMGFDSIDEIRDRFGGTANFNAGSSDESTRESSRMIRVLERQYKKLMKMKSFINIRTGDRQEIPHTWDDNKISLMLEQAQGAVIVDDHVGHKIRWTVTAEDFVLFDDWSPYKHFTVIPYFPFFMYGTTIGLIENILDPQEVLNKTVSQELHVVNTTANSGWKTKTGNIKNYTPDELESHGAKTGIVLEVDDVTQTEKITPNQIPTGLDRLSSKAEGFIKSVSGRGDAQLGMTRADVSADQIEANNQMSDVGLRKSTDNLKRTDFLIARNVLDLIQEYYTDPRIMTITHDDLTGDQSEVKINWPDVESGEIQNDVTMGEYDVVVVSQNVKETLDQNNLELALKMREAGIDIPAESIVENSNLIGKSKIIKAMREQAASPEAQLDKQVNQLGKQLTVAELKSKTSKNEADATLKKAKAGEAVAKMQKEAQGDVGEQEKAQQEMALEQQKHDAEMQRDKEKHDQEMQQQREKQALDMELKEKEAKDKRLLMRAQAVAAMKQTTENPTGQEKKAA